MSSGSASATSTISFEGFADRLLDCLRFRLLVELGVSLSGVARGVLAAEVDALSGVIDGVEGVEGRPYEANDFRSEVKRTC